LCQNRLEIISPGKLTNSLTIDKIKSGLSIHRNPILNSVCKTVLPYSGYGSGIKRVLSINPDVELINDTDKEEFKCIIYR
jgi:predicted HTH transcriptional regulator